MAGNDMTRRDRAANRSSASVPRADEGAPAPVLARVLAILDVVKNARGAVSIVDIEAATGIPKSTTARVVGELVDQRYLARGRAGVTLGVKLYGLGARATIPQRIARAAEPVVRRLAASTGERVGVWVQQGVDMVSLTAFPGRLPMLSTRVGMRSPALTTASGKAYLAFCDDQAVVDRVSAPLDGGDAQRFRHELASVRRSVVATDPGVAYLGIVAVASPLMGRSGAVVGALSVAGPASGMEPNRMSPLVRSASRTLADRLATV